MQSVIEESGFKTDVKRTPSLPFQIGIDVLQQALRYRWHAIIRHNAVGHQSIESIVGRDSAEISRSSVACSQFEEVAMPQVSQPRLLLNVPLKANRRKITPGVVVAH